MRQLWFTCLEKAEDEPNIAIPVALAEALKIRIITKGPPFRQYVLRYIQKELHSTLRKIPQFALIGSPTGGAPSFASYLTKVLRIDEELHDHERLFLSGDYKAATDKLKSWASEAAAEAVCDALEYPVVMRKLFVDSLTRHIIQWNMDPESFTRVSYDNAKGQPMFFAQGEQKVGQLMGSIVSFPILCIVNAAISRYSQELAELREIPIRKMPMAINGDDIVISTTERGKDYWRQIVKLVGLEESVGKTFFNKDFLQINSTNFSLTERGKLVQVPYVNMGLLTGQKRSVKGKAGKIDLYDQTEFTFGARYRQLISTCPPRLQNEVHKLFVTHNKTTLSKVRVPWYIPEWIGGFGLTGLKRPSELDLRMAQRILFRWKTERPYPLGSNPTRWRVWDLARNRLPKPIVVDNINDGVEEYADALNAQACDLLLDTRIKLDDLLTAEGDSKFIKSKIRRNELLWKPARGKLPQPIAEEKLIFVKRFDSMQREPAPNPDERKIELDPYTQPGDTMTGNTEGKVTIQIPTTQIINSVPGLVHTPKEEVYKQQEEGKFFHSWRAMPEHSTLWDDEEKVTDLENFQAQHNQNIKPTKFKTLSQTRYEKNKNMTTAERRHIAAEYERVTYDDQWMY
jgi:hypothetical protein